MFEGVGVCWLGCYGFISFAFRFVVLCFCLCLNILNVVRGTPYPVLGGENPLRGFSWGDLLTGGGMRRSRRGLPLVNPSWEVGVIIYPSIQFGRGGMGGKNLPRG